MTAINRIDFTSSKKRMRAINWVDFTSSKKRRRVVNWVKKWVKNLNDWISIRDSIWLNGWGGY